LLAILNSGVTNQLSGGNVADLIAIRLVHLALAGSLQLIKEIADRTERRVPQARVRNLGTGTLRSILNVSAIIGGKEAFDRVRREANGRNQNCKTS